MTPIGEATPSAMAEKDARGTSHLPIRRSGPDRRREAIERLKEFAKGRTLDVPIKQLINEGRP